MGYDLLMCSDPHTGNSFVVVSSVAKLVGTNHASFQCSCCFRPHTSPMLILNCTSVAALKVIIWRAIMLIVARGGIPACCSRCGYMLIGQRRDLMVPASMPGRRGRGGGHGDRRSEVGGKQQPLALLDGYRINGKEEVSMAVCGVVVGGDGLVRRSQKSMAEEKQSARGMIPGLKSGMAYGDV